MATKVNGGINAVDVNEKQTAHAHVWALSNVNLAVTGVGTIHNLYTVAAGNTVLLTAQSAPAENGLWIANTAAAWTRSPLWPTGSVYPVGLTVFMANSLFVAGPYMMSTPTPVVVGTDTSAWAGQPVGAPVTENFIADNAVTTNKILANDVTNAKLGTVAAYTLKGNATGSTANPTDIAIGTHQTLQRGASGNIVAGSPSRVVAQTPTDATVNNTVTETDLASLTVPAGLVVPGDRLHLYAEGDLLNNSGSASNWTWRLRIATSSIIISPVISHAAGANRWRWRVHVQILVGAAVTAQEISILHTQSAAVGGSGTGALLDATKCWSHQNTAAANMANSTNFAYQVTHGTAASTIETICKSSSIELIRNL